MIGSLHEVYQALSMHSAKSVKCTKQEVSYQKFVSTLNSRHLKTASLIYWIQLELLQFGNSLRSISPAANGAVDEIKPLCTVDQHNYLQYSTIYLHIVLHSHVFHITSQGHWNSCAMYPNTIPTDLLHLLIPKAASCDSSQRQLHLCHHTCFLIIPSAGAIAIGHHPRAIATRLNCLACLVFVVIPGRNDMTDWSFSCPRELAPPIRPPQKQAL